MPFELVKCGVTEGATNTPRSLTHSSDRTREGLRMQPTEPTGFCECGCGQRTPIAKRNRSGDARIRKGQPVRFIPGHSGRLRTKQATPVEVRFMSKVRKTETCWLWTTGIDDKGYGRFSIGSRTTTGLKNVKAHIFSYEMANGPVPDGLVLDHICRVRHCVNPDHLQAVTMRVNVLRGIGPAAVNSRRSKCINGHRFDAQNTKIYVRRNGNQMRICIKCASDRKQRRTREAIGRDKTGGHY